MDFKCQTVQVTAGIQTKQVKERREGKIDQQGASIAQQGAEIKDLQTQVQTLQTRVQTLELSSKGHRDVRHRFLEIYRRDAMPEHPPSYFKISTGNKVAHHGDCVTDADLYLAGERRDGLTFTKIYGVTPFEIQQLDARKDDKVLRTINNYGTLKADTTRELPNSLCEAYSDFTTLVIGSDDISDIDDVSTKAGKAYNKVWVEFSKLQK